jgi:hypothetical protein
MDCLLLLLLLQEAPEAEKYYTLEKHTALIHYCCRFQETASLSRVCVCVCERISYRAIQTELSLSRCV